VLHLPLPRPPICGQRATKNKPFRTRAFDVGNDDPNLAGVAGRYASALYDLAAEQNAVVSVEQDLIGLQKLIDENPDLKRLVLSPVFSADEQTRAVGAVLEKAGIGPLTLNFIKVVARNRRLFSAPDMIKAYRSIAAKARGEVSAEVSSAYPLSAEQFQALRDTLRGSVGKDVALATRVDPGLLGGLVVKIGSRMIDSSLRTKLTSLKTRMKEVR
jgi:F-type H+-transporting ATPase subunit delta